MSDQNQPGQPYPYGGQPPPYGGQQPSYGGQQPPYGEQQPQYGGQQPHYGGEQPPYGGTPQSPPYGQPPQYDPQPQYGQPQQPQYGGTTYGGTTYGTPQQPYGSPQSPYGPPDSAPPGAFPPPGPFPQQPKQRRVGRILGIVGGSLAAVLVLCCGAGYLFGGRDILAERNATLSTPDTVAGLKKSTNAQLQPFAEKATADLKEESGLTSTIAAFYEDPKDRQKLVMLVGGTKLLLRPESELDDAFRGFNEGADNDVKNVVEVDAGDLGGKARCGSVTEEGTESALCAWADHGSIVLGVFFNRPVNESAALLRQIRSEILTRD